MKSDNFNLFYYILIIKKYHKFIITFILCSLVSTAIFSLLSEKIYITRAKFLITVPYINKDIFPASSDFYGVPINKSSVFFMINSRYMKDKVIKKFFPESVNDNLKMDKLITSLSKSINIIGAADEQGGILEVKGHNPKLISDIANYILNNVNLINEEKRICSLRNIIKIVDPAYVPLKPIDVSLAKRLIVVLILSSIFSSILFFVINFFENEKFNFNNSN